MKNEIHSRRNPWLGFAEKLLTALTAVSALIAAIPFLSNAAGRFDDQKCSLTVKAIEEFQESLTGSDLVIDLYLIADAIPFTGSDGYSYRLRPEFEDLTVGPDMSVEDWHHTAQLAAGAALKKMPVKPVRQLTFGQKSDQDLEPGLYLLIARNKNAIPEDYVDYITVTEEEGTDPESRLVTRAYIGEYVYTFLPELVTFPGKEAIDGVIDTAGPGDWIYDLEVYLKPEQDSRYGALKIIKTLQNYNVSGGPATFVFDVEAEWKGKKVYSNVVSVIFDHPGEETILVEKIPVGAEVTVTEIYTGASYKLISKSEQETVITENMENPAAVSFTNDYDDRQNGGHSITNHFTYEYNQDAEAGSAVSKGIWKLEQLYDGFENRED